jgi:murein DD-endopeptidase MepM/ murein hydrolase activator NlpD
MNKFFAIAALTATAGAVLVSPAAAAEPVSAPAAALSASTLDFMGRKVNFEAAADAETMATPTKNFHLSARFGQSGPYWSTGKHMGLDFAAPMGTAILAADSGTVVEAGQAGAYGNFVEIAHGDGTRTRYAHLSSIAVEKGQSVDRGQRLGGLGSTGNSTGPHLHFEVVRDGVQVDPEKFLNL